MDNVATTGYIIYRGMMNPISMKLKVLVSEGLDDLKFETKIYIIQLLIDILLKLLMITIIFRNPAFLWK